MCRRLGVKIVRTVTHSIVVSGAERATCCCSRRSTYKSCWQYGSIPIRLSSKSVQMTNSKPTSNNVWSVRSGSLSSGDWSLEPKAQLVWAALLAARLRKTGLLRRWLGCCVLHSCDGAFPGADAKHELCSGARVSTTAPRTP